MTIKYPVAVAQEPEGEPDIDTMIVIRDATGRALEPEEIAEALNTLQSATNSSESGGGNGRKGSDAAKSLECAPATPLNCDRDPARWAREFNDTLRKQGVPPFDPGFLIGWFANAMMCGEDTYRWRQEATKASTDTTPF